MLLHQVNADKSGRIGDSHTVADNGHLPLTRKSVKYDADVHVDYLLAAYRPGLNPQLPEQQQQVWSENHARARSARNSSTECTWGTMCRASISAQSVGSGRSSRQSGRVYSPTCLA